MFASKSSIFVFYLLITTVVLLWSSTNTLPIDSDEDGVSYWLSFARRASLRPFIVRQRALHDKRASLRPRGGQTSVSSSHLPQYYAYSLG